MGLTVFLLTTWLICSSDLAEMLRLCDCYYSDVSEYSEKFAPENKAV